MGALPRIFSRESEHDILEVEFEGLMQQLFEDIRPGDRFMLGMGDNVPTDGSVERLERVSETLARPGRLPIC